jgi:predicted HTH transcriptional regulator
MESWQWIFVFFAILMVARIVPRIIRRGKMNLQRSDVVTSDQTFLNESKMQPFVKEAQEPHFSKETKPESKDMIVLGHINRGYKTFNEIRKKTGFDSKELNSILEDLETRGLMKVQKKQGLLGIKVELIPTEKGYREYDS